MKVVIGIMVICSWLFLSLAIPSTMYHWYIYVIEFIGAYTSCYFLLNIWDKLKDR